MFEYINRIFFIERPDDLAMGAHAVAAVVLVAAMLQLHIGVGSSKQVLP